MDSLMPECTHEWISVHEKVPANNETVIAWIKYSSGRTRVTVAQYSIDPVITSAVLDRNGKPVWYDWLSRIYSHDAVSYWMPMPEAPAFEVDDEDEDS